MVFFCEYCEFFKNAYYENICEELLLKKLAASVLALLINADYLLTGYELIGKKIDSC